MSEQAHVVLGITRKSLEATVVHACPYCGAPGLYKNDAYNAKNWPGIIDPKRNNQPVGNVCPNCNRDRRKDLSLGELSASMPKWVWNCILVFKWCLIKMQRRNHGPRLYGTEPD